MLKNRRPGPRRRTAYRPRWHSRPSAGLL